eukprot:gene18700-35585_t
MAAKEVAIDLAIPKAGLVYPSASNRLPINCKPKILPLKSASLMKQEQQAKAASDVQEEMAKQQKQEQGAR